MHYIKIPYDLFKQMVLEGKEKDVEIYEAARDYKIMEQRLEDEEAAHAELKEKWAQGR